MAVSCSARWRTTSDSEPADALAGRDLPRADDFGEIDLMNLPVEVTDTLTHGKSQGVVPFLKVVNDTAVAVNQGGKRKGAFCAYLECWHLDVEEFLELRKNTGDDRRRTHDMNTANWIPDLFMKRVFEDGDWTMQIKIC